MATVLVSGWVGVAETWARDELKLAERQRCLDEESALLRAAERRGLGKVVGDKDNLLRIDENTRLKASELLERRALVFEEACRAFLATTSQDELERIADELAASSGGFFRGVGPFIGVILGAVLALAGGFFLQRREQRSIRIAAMKDRVLDALSAGDSWVRLKKQETPETAEVVGKKKAEALAAGTSLLSALFMAKSDPSLIGGTQVSDDITRLHKCADRIFSEEGYIAENKTNQAERDLAGLTGLVGQAIQDPRLLPWPRSSRTRPANGRQG